MRFPRQMIGTAGLCVMVALALTGCFHYDRSVQLNSDGSGKYTFTLGLSDQLLALDTTGQLKKGFNDCGTQLKASGTSYSTHDDGDYTYWSFGRDFKTVKELNGLLNNTVNSQGIQGCNIGNSPDTSSLTQSAPTDTFTVTEQSGFLSNTFHVTGHFSLQSSATGAGSTGDPSTQALLAGIRETFAVTMPNGISAHKGGAVNGNTITYTIHLNEAADIDVTGSGTNTGVVVGLIGGGALVLIGGGLAVFLITRRRTAGAQTQPVPVATPAGGDAWPGGSSSDA